MGLIFRRRVRLGRRSWLNLSGSGVSASVRLGKRVTLNSHGQVNVRLAKGISWRIR